MCFGFIRHGSFAADAGCIEMLLELFQKRNGFECHAKKSTEIEYRLCF